MKKVFFLTVLFCVTLSFSSASLAQKRKILRRPVSKKPVTIAVTAAPLKSEIPVAEWSVLITALDNEDWSRASVLASLALNKLKIDNDKKQLARLRYFYLYASAGKVAQRKMAYTELEKIAAAFTGKEFLMPGRRILTDCKGKVNYICPVKNNEKALRVTATNKTGTAIHSFEYVQLRENFSAGENSGKSALVGGNLQKAEFNPKRSDIWIMRLTFDKGFISIIPSP